MKVKITAEVDERIKLLNYTKSRGGQGIPISGNNFNVIYEANEDWLQLDIYFGQDGPMINLQKPIELKFKTEWRIDLDQCSGVDCPIIDPRNINTDARVKTHCVFENRENSKYKMI